MRTARIVRAAVALFLLLNIAAHAAELTTSRLDPALASERERLFLPWSNPQDAAAYRKMLSGPQVSLYSERRADGSRRDLYIPNPGTGFWIEGDVAPSRLFLAHRDKLHAGESIMSASAHTDARGGTSYWILWVPNEKVPLVQAKMAALGITPASITLNPYERLVLWLDNYPSLILASRILFGIIVAIALAFAFRQAFLRARTALKKRR